MILITGVCGFIGFHLAKQSLKRNKEVIGIDCIDNYYLKKKKYQRLAILKKFNNFKFFKIDLNDFSKTNSLLKKFKITVIVHLAAQPGVRVSIKNPHNTLRQNLIPFINIIEIARLKKIKKFIYASSSSVYGDSKIYPFNEKDFQNVPVSVYGASKLSNEILAEAYARNFKLKCIGLRFFTVYGPYGRPDMAYYSFLNSLKNNKIIKVFNNGNMMRDFTYIDDVIDGITNVIKAKFVNIHEVLNIGKGNPDKLMDLINYLEKNYLKKFKINFTKNIPLGDIKKTYSNVNKAKKIINWQPKTSLKVGIEKFVQWYKSNKI
jgi:UDP-glucuronate 4-epimerase